MVQKNKAEFKENFKDKKILITGGLGFIGSNLAIKLVENGANVTLADAMIADYGGNLFNIEPIKEEVKINYNNITDKEAMEMLVREKDYIFHFAGQVSHVLSFSDPRPDCDYNLTGTAILLDACSKFNNNAIIVYAGTRGEYGMGIKLPASEEHPINPLDVHEVTKLAAGHLLQAYKRKERIKDYIWTRLTNIYGPRSQMISNKYGILNWFIRQAMDDEEIKVFGEGKMLRDYLYIDDCIDAILRVSSNDEALGNIFNVGHNQPVPTLDLVKKIIEKAGSGSYTLTEYSEERKHQEVHNWSTDYSKLKRITGWGPTTSLEEGLEKTIEYYRTHKERYW